MDESPRTEWYLEKLLGLLNLKHKQTEEYLRGLLSLVKRSTDTFQTRRPLAYCEQEKASLQDTRLTFIFNSASAMGKVRKYYFYLRRYKGIMQRGVWIMNVHCAARGMPRDLCVIRVSGLRTYIFGSIFWAAVIGLLLDKYPAASVRGPWCYD